MIGSKRFVQLGRAVFAAQQEPRDESQQPPHVSTEIPRPLDAICGLLRRQGDCYGAQRGDDRYSHDRRPGCAYQAQAADRQPTGNGEGVGDRGPAACGEAAWCA